MTGTSSIAGRRTSYLAALACGMMALAVSGQAWATPGKGGMGVEDHSHGNSGSSGGSCGGGCGGGGGGGGASPQDLQDARQRAGGDADAAMDQTGSGFSGGSAGRPNMDQSGAIARAGASQGDADADADLARRQREYLENAALVLMGLGLVDPRGGLYQPSANDILRPGSAGPPAGSAPATSSTTPPGDSSPGLAGSSSGGQGSATSGDQHGQRGTSLDMLTILNAATNRASGRSGILSTDRHDINVGAAQVQHGVQGLTGASSPGATPPVGVATPPGNIPPQAIITPLTPIDAPLLGSTTVSPTAVPPTSPPANNWQVLPPVPTPPASTYTPPPAPYTPPPPDDPPPAAPPPVAPSPPPPDDLDGFGTFDRRNQ